MKKNNEIVLVCKSVEFGSQNDENAFFEWIGKINCIESILDQGKELYLHINKTTIDEYELRDILALFDRYKVNMKQLAQFLASDNKEWFYDKKSYWYKRVFGDAGKIKSRKSAKT